MPPSHSNRYAVKLARIKHMGRTAKVHGFRPGKVPFKILEQQFGAQAHQEVLGDELQRSFAEAAKANNLKVAGYPNFEIKTTDMSAPQIEFSATFEVYPEVVVGDVSGESIERVTFSLNDADIDNTITRCVNNARCLSQPSALHKMEIRYALILAARWMGWYSMAAKPKTSLWCWVLGACCRTLKMP